MSRIDEALKRVAETAAVEARGGVGAIIRPARRPDEGILEHYPAESVAIDATVSSSLAVDRSRERSSRVQPTRPVPPAADETLGPFEPTFEGKLVIGDTAPALCVEQYRRLAAAMHELQQERELKTLMVTSALPREGKTLTVTNLALTLSNSYARRVLLIDADLRRPSVHEVLNLPNIGGLSEALRSDRAELPLRRVSPLLTVLTAGRAHNDPMALLTSERMQRLLEESAARFDWVLLDAPPVGFMPDAGVLAGMTRAILFVISAGSTPYQLVQRATAELGHDCIVGTVLNRIEEQNIPATGYYHSYYAGKSEG
jgi:capsular exopolysaccharide synthesis family protein